GEVMETQPPSLADTPAVILCGGLGTRLRGVLADRPKGLAPVAGRPFLELQIELLRDAGLRRFVLCVGHMAEQIADHFGDGSALGVRVDYSVERGGLLGTAGALKLAADHFAPRALVFNGDTYLAADYSALLRSHVRERAARAASLTLTLARAPEGTRFGRAVLDPSGRYLLGFEEKSETGRDADNWLNAGAYVVERELLDEVPPGRPVSLEREVFPQLIASGRR